MLGLMQQHFRFSFAQGELQDLSAPVFIQCFYKICLVLIHSVYNQQILALRQLENKYCSLLFLASKTFVSQTARSQFLILNIARHYASGILTFQPVFSVACCNGIYQVNVKVQAKRWKKHDLRVVELVSSWRHICISLVT